MTTENICLKFAITMAKICGMTYTQATKKYPRGYDGKSVYIDGVQTHHGHCVHCARAETISKNHSYGKGVEQ